MYYLDFVNNFLTVECFAEYYDLTIEQANSIIARSKVIHFSECVECDKDLIFVKDYSCYSANNALFFRKRDEKHLLAEHSA